ncbi:hypothetical protein OBBRIDRAFT_734571 [Obba rivulosa]|uniref:DUF6533 domain-containing protein n=1 Tax=Obba rivulosa TaxID=1052685 RepID=A0A8E2DHM5_9APHY|nr:hypothetical protein OBBRIDRAFT_734571 [Obba rivulosa]
MLCTYFHVHQALVIYDLLCTAYQEVRFIRERKFNVVTLLFHLNRWMIFIYAFSNLALVPNMYSLPVCPMNRISCIPPFDSLPPGVSLSTCIPALTASDRCKAMNFLDIISSMLLYAVWASRSHVSEYTIEYLYPLIIGAVVIATRCCSILSDLVTLIVTFKKTYHIRRTAAQTNITTPATTLLLRDGELFRDV